MAVGARKAAMNFKKMLQTDVPQGRSGKHKSIVTRILSDLDQIDDGVALKVPLTDLAESKEKVRSALNRATRKAGLKVATASDDKFFVRLERASLGSGDAAHFADSAPGGSVNGSTGIRS